MKNLLLPICCFYFAAGFAQGPAIMTKHDIVPGPVSSTPVILFNLNNVLYFTADTPGKGRELWKYDKASGLSELVKDINGPNPGYVAGATVMGNNIYFAADTDSSGTELWISDGTGAGTKMLKDIWPGASGYNAVYEKIIINGKLLFSAQDGVNGTELWATDGTPAGTVMLKDINTGAKASQPFGFTAYKNKVFFAAHEEATGRELWETDGTEVGTKLVADLRPGDKGMVNRSWVFFNELYFSGAVGYTGSELCKTDGTAGGCKLIRDIMPGGDAGFTALEMVEYRGKLFFVGNDGMHGPELWVTDGTEQGTQMIKDIWPGTAGAGASELTVFEDRLYFRSGSPPQELWVSDGTPQGTVPYVSLFPGITPLTPRAFVVYNHYLYFIAVEQGVNGRLMRIDGKNPVEVVAPDLSLGGYSGPLYVFDSALYFTANDTISGFELWSLKDTNNYAGVGEIQTGGTLFSISPNPSNGNFRIILNDVVHGEAYIAIYDLSGNKIYREAMANGRDVYDIRCGHLSAGIYIVQLKQDNSVTSKKLVVY